MKKIYSTTLQKPPSFPGDVGFTFYEDRQLIIGASATWINNTDIEKIKFTPTSKVPQDYFQIIDINPCQLKDSKKNFFMVHIWRNKNAANNKEYTSLVTNDLKGIDLQYEFNTELFIFNIHETEQMPVIDNDKECLFTVITPKTKDGAIIVGG